MGSYGGTVSGLLGNGSYVRRGVPRAVTAAPFVHVESSMIASPNRRSAEEIYNYNYNGRYYPYRYNNRYYAHRIYRQGHGGIIDLFNAEGEVDMSVFMRNLSSLKMDAAEAGTPAKY